MIQNEKIILTIYNIILYIYILLFIILTVYNIILIIIIFVLTK